MSLNPVSTAFLMLADLGYFSSSAAGKVGDFVSGSAASYYSSCAGYFLENSKFGRESSINNTSPDSASSLFAGS